MGYINNALFSKLPSLAGKLGGYSATRSAAQAASQSSAAKEQFSKIEWLPDALHNAKIDKQPVASLRTVGQKPIEPEKVSLTEGKPAAERFKGYYSTFGTVYVRDQSK